MTARRLGIALVELVAPDHLRDTIVGDFEQRRSFGSGRSDGAFWYDVIGSLWPLTLANARSIILPASLVGGCVGFATFYLVAHLGALVGIAVQPFQDVAFVTISVAVCAAPRIGRAGAGIVQALALLGWWGAHLVLHPGESVRFRELTCYEPFLWLAASVAVIAIVRRACRRTMRAT